MQYAKPSDGSIFPEYLPSMAYGDVAIIEWNMAPAIGDATISSASFISCPNDFSFTTPVVDGGTVTTTISGGKCSRDYKITGTLVTSDGQTRHPYCFVRVE